MNSLEKTYLSEMSYSDFREKLISYEKPGSSTYVSYLFWETTLTRYYQDDLGEQEDPSACSIGVKVMSREQLKIHITIEPDVKNLIGIIFFILFMIMVFLQNFI